MLRWFLTGIFPILPRRFSTKGNTIYFRRPRPIRRPHYKELANFQAFWSWFWHFKHLKNKLPEIVWYFFYIPQVQLQPLVNIFKIYMYGNINTILIQTRESLDFFCQSFFKLYMYIFLTDPGCNRGCSSTSLLIHSFIQSVSQSAFSSKSQITDSDIQEAEISLKCSPPDNMSHVTCHL